MKDRIIDVGTADLSDEVRNVGIQTDDIANSVSDTANELNDIVRRIEDMQKSLGINCYKRDSRSIINDDIKEINIAVDDLLKNNSLFDKTPIFPKLSETDMIVSCICGIVAAIIDIAFVGTPQVRKLYNGKEGFDGGLLTKLLRNIGNNKKKGIGKLFYHLSKRCKVPYDISSKKGVVCPNNHRLRCFAHDPLYGLMFAVVDIIYDTCTCIDDTGCLRILVNNKNSVENKWLAVIYYFGHLLSDVSTSRGLPVPGFCFLEFFTQEASDKSIAKIAEDMYISGYDLRHYTSMSITVILIDNLINIYNKLVNINTDDIFETISEKEKKRVDYNLKRIKMKAIAKGTACTGNIVKFISPPNCGNPKDVNMAEWISFLHTGVQMIKAASRDMAIEQVMCQREQLDKGWDDLLLKVSIKEKKDE